jgi:hypothetical protein
MTVQQPKTKRKKMPRFRRKPANRSRWEINGPDGIEVIVDLARWCKRHGFDYKQTWRDKFAGDYTITKVDTD